MFKKGVPESVPQRETDLVRKPASTRFLERITVSQKSNFWTFGSAEPIVLSL